MKHLNIIFILSIIFYISIISNCFKFTCVGKDYKAPCYIYMNPYGISFRYKVLKELYDFDYWIYYKVETMVKESCTRSKKLGDVNNYIRKKVPHSVILSICYRLGIYTKCRLNTILVLSPKLSNKRKCRDFIGMIDRHEHKGDIGLRMPQLRRQSLKLF
uniref:Uncharacterized protein n=1 Tax=Strongyloides papillosus TaxID=174720 RepID=A0A0N5CDU0_STREA